MQSMIRSFIISVGAWCVMASKYTPELSLACRHLSSESVRSRLRVWWVLECDSLAGGSARGISASGLQRIEQVQIARLVVLQGHQGGRQAAQQLLVLNYELVIGVCGMPLRRSPPSLSSYKHHLLVLSMNVHKWNQLSLQ